MLVGCRAPNELANKHFFRYQTSMALRQGRELDQHLYFGVKTLALELYELQRVIRRLGVHCKDCCCPQTLGMSLVLAGSPELPPAPLAAASVTCTQQRIDHVSSTRSDDRRAVKCAVHPTREPGTRCSRALVVRARSRRKSKRSCGVFRYL